MGRVKTTGRRVLLLAALMLTGAPAPGAADTALDPDRIGWSAVQVKATKFFVSMTAGISINPLGMASMQGILIEPGEGRPVAPKGSMRELVIRLRGLGRKVGPH